MPSEELLELGLFLLSTTADDRNALAESDFLDLVEWLTDGLELETWLDIGLQLRAAQKMQKVMLISRRDGLPLMSESNEREMVKREYRPLRCCKVRS